MKNEANEIDNISAVVLIVDDCTDSLSMLNDLLDHEGITVLVSLSGKQALSIASSVVPDLILLDAIMPTLDGFETCKLLKSDPILENIPVIFMTGLTDTASIVKGLEAGGVDYVTKPINSKELIARIKVHLNNSKLTKTASKILDNTGQYLFSSNNLGKLQWATPLTKQLFIDCKKNEAWTEFELPKLLLKLIDENSSKIVFDRDKIPLKIDLINKLDENEYLFRISKIDKNNDTISLKSKFGLTNRESEVLYWIAKGKTNREIGTILSISPRTANKHLEQIYKKLGVENRTSAATKAISIISE